MESAAKRDADDRVCDVSGCDRVSERSLSRKQVSQSSLQLKSGDVRQVRLCKEHYKEFKKETKTARKLDTIY
ncbi:MAG: hypothetical protein RBQ77_03285 [Candidatus Methanomethylophilaceae archaeon]|jgi:hypothetical protein|nr:hypothetical protein [Candidatus Methanomethylophilaceae archaeon]NLF33738.1 hypothetical protein [Thermoplasmatales archaeon]